MSVRVMTAVWALDLPAGDKLALLALADCANDEGACWPGIKTLITKTGKCERSLQAAIKALTDAGHLTRNEVAGKGCNYIVHPRNNCAPAKSAPPQKLPETPAKIAGKPLRTVKTEANASVRKKPKLPLPSNWEPQPIDPESEVGAIIAPWQPGRMERELSKFKDRAIANDQRQSDWQAAFRNWLKIADEMDRRYGRTSQHHSNIGKSQAGFAMLNLRADEAF